MKLRLVAAAAVVALLASCGGPAARDRPRALAVAAHVHGQGIGDPYYPDDGNLGYDVVRYDVALRYHPSGTSISASTLVTARASTRLPSFDLDLRGLHVDRVNVDGTPAAFVRRPVHELVITPAQPIGAGATFRARVTYHGQMALDTSGPVDSGWHSATTPGSGFIAGEPHSCTSWYPCNDHPIDKAEFSLRATVPKPFSVISNGDQLPTVDRTGTLRTFRWRLREPTATYLTMMYVDKLRFEHTRLPDGVPIVNAYGPGPSGAPRREAQLPAILAFLSARFGPYPAPGAGGVFVDASFGFSLETFTRPTYTKNVDVSTIVHENAHQWWGDNVSIERWRDICLNECFASYAQWMWAEHNGADLDAMYRSQVEHYPGAFRYPLYDMGRGHEFDFEGVYFKGQWFLHALRSKLGTRQFFAALRTIQRSHVNGHLSMVGLRDALEAQTGVDLTSFWDDWVFHTGKPSNANLYPGGLAR